MSGADRVGAAARQFAIDGELKRVEPFGSGHINDTYRVTFARGAAATSYVLQRINNSIFKTPEALMENVQRVTAHLAAQVADEPDRARRALTLIETRDGRGWPRWPSIIRLPPRTSWRWPGPTSRTTPPSISRSCRSAPACPNWKNRRIPSLSRRLLRRLRRWPG